MAGLAGLPYFIQYQGQLQQQEQAKQQQQMQMQLFQQAQQDRQRQQAAQAAAGNALPQLLQGGMPAQQPQMPPPPQPPAPGQASQPMQQPQGAAPMPGMGPAPGGVQPPLPPGGVPQGAQQQPIPPFRPMPTTPPQSVAAPQGAIPAPPAQAAATAPSQGGGPLTLQGAVKVLQDQGLSGADLMAGLAQLTPVLDSASKAQAAQLQQQFNNDLKLQAVQDRHDALEQRREAAQQASEDRRLSIQQRADAARESAALRGESIALRKQQVALSNGDDAKFSPDDLKFLAEQARQGDTSVYQNLGRGAQGAKNIIALRREVMKQTREAGETGADIAAANAGFQGEKAAARTGATRAANIGMAVSEAKNTFPLVRQASAALPRTEFVPVNRALQAAQTNTGDPRVVALGTAINTSINAYARAISPTGVPTVADKEHARELLSTASTPDQLNAVLNVMEKEMAAAQKAPTEVMARQKARISGRAEPTEPGTGGPAVGTVESGYRFKGGDPASPSSWERVQ
jgi:hypothetical protein